MKPLQDGGTTGICANMVVFSGDYFLLNGFESIRIDMYLSEEGFVHAIELIYIEKFQKKRKY